MADLLSNVLVEQFDPSVDQRSPLEPEYHRVVKKDEKGGEYVVYEEFDLAAYQKSLGLVDNWSLDSLIKAGIDPKFPIRTGFNARIEGVGVVNDAANFVESNFSNSVESNTE